MIEAAVGIGVILSLVFAELLGASAGGIVVPGYIALYLDQPQFIVMTLVVSLVTWGIIRVISTFTLLFGKRRMVLSILIGFILGSVSKNFLLPYITFLDMQLYSIGYIIPGLIANWFERQGFVKTMTVMFIAAVLVRITIIIIFKGEANFNV
ncbi:MAG: poly-gamma-glutamate biosynthesis protein PgsC [Candidatus Cloacimonetes bacterium]|nr:poly-gamma-glutamate biosynthesis protein PgsC [Candidatus Cloacimonadota bacterium]